MSLSPETSSGRQIPSISISALSPETRRKIEALSISLSAVTTISRRQIKPFSVGLPAHVGFVRNEYMGDPISQIRELASLHGIKIIPSNILEPMPYESDRKNMNHTVGAFMKSLEPKLHEAVSGFVEAKGYGLCTNIAVLPGPLSHVLQYKPANDVVKPFPLLPLLLQILGFYKEAAAKLKAEGASCIQFDEPMLVTGLKSHELQAFTTAYSLLKSSLTGLEVLVATYCGNVPPAAFETLIALEGVTAIGLDLVHGSNNIDLIKKGFPRDKILFAGVVDGRSTRPNDVAASLKILHALEGVVGKGNLVVSTCCPLFYDAATDPVRVKDYESSWRVIATQKFSEVAILSHQIMYSNADNQERSRTDSEQKIQLVNFDQRLQNTEEEVEAHRERLNMVEAQIAEIQELSHANRELKKEHLQLHQILVDTAEQTEAHGGRLNIVEEQASLALGMHAGNNARQKARKWLRCCSCFK